ncbi:unnamed protein product [Closterium sp. NIES-53]
MRKRSYPHQTSSSPDNPLSPPSFLPPPPTTPFPPKLPSSSPDNPLYPPNFLPLRSPSSAFNQIETHASPNFHRPIYCRIESSKQQQTQEFANREHGTSNPTRASHSKNGQHNFWSSFFKPSQAQGVPNVLPLPLKCCCSPSLPILRLNLPHGILLFLRRRRRRWRFVSERAPQPALRQALPRRASALMGQVGVRDPRAARDG